MAFYTELSNTYHTNTQVLYVSKGIYFAPNLYTAHKFQATVILNDQAPKVPSSSPKSK